MSKAKKEEKKINFARHLEQGTLKSEARKSYFQYPLCVILHSMTFLDHVSNKINYESLLKCVVKWRLHRERSFLTLKSGNKSCSNFNIAKFYLFLLKLSKSDNKFRYAVFFNHVIYNPHTQSSPTPRFILPRELSV